MWKGVFIAMHRSKIRTYFDGFRPTGMTVEEIDEFLKEEEERVSKLTWEEIGDPDDC